MAWRLAKALEQLRKQINEEFPNRRKDSDGTIGDTDHNKRTSDHNPWVDGSVVTALDLTHDPKSGMDSYWLAQSLVDSKDSRIKYIISNGKICSGAGQDQPAWEWRAYTGKNRHDHHVHISVRPAAGFYDDTRPWKFTIHKEGTLPTKDFKEPPPTLHKGDQGADVIELQRLLSLQKGFTLAGDGVFGPVTEQAVKAFQHNHMLVVDGIVGPMTWTILQRKGK